MSFGGEWPIFVRIKPQGVRGARYAKYSATDATTKPPNGKIERWHRWLKRECLRPGVPGAALGGWPRGLLQSLQLQSAIGYVAPLDKLEGRAEAIRAEWDRKLEEARRKR